MAENGSVKTAGKLVPLRPGMFRMPGAVGDPVHLLAVRCRSCGETFFPKRVFCANCSGGDMEEVELPDRGEIQTFTIVRQQLPGSAMEPPYAIVRVALQGGLSVQTVIPACESLRIGAPVEFIAGRIMQDEAGDTVVSFIARPLAGTPG